MPTSYSFFAHSLSNFPFHTTKMLFDVSPSVPSVNQTEEDVITLVKQSLKNLQTDYIDL